MESFNQYLQELVKRIQGLPQNSGEKRKLLNEFTKLISPELIKLCSPESKNVDEYEDLRADALAITIEKIPEIIEKYDSTKGRTILNYVKTACKLERPNLYRALKKKKEEEQSLDAMKDDTDFESAASEVNQDKVSIRYSFDKLVAKNAPKLLKEIKEFIEKDPENFLTNTVIRSKNPGKQISLQRALLMRLQDKTLKEISAETGVPLKSISSCIDRKMPKVKRYITKHTGIEFIS